MKMNGIFVILFLTALVACIQKPNVDFVVAVDSGANIDSFHLLSIFESQNYELINNNEELVRRYLLTGEIEILREEFDSTENSRDSIIHQYHIIEDIALSDHRIALIGKSIVGKGRNYSILYRVYDDKGSILNTVTVACWNERLKNFYGCEISNNWKKIKHIHDGEIIREFSVTDSWQILNNDML